MPAPNKTPPATVPEQPEIKSPVKKTMPVIVVLVVILVLIGIANVSSLLHGSQHSAPGTSLSVRPSAPNAQEVNDFETQQALQAKRDAQRRQYQKELAAAQQELQAAEAGPGPEGKDVPAMTPQQRAVIYGSSPNAPVVTSEASQQEAEARQRELAKQREHQQALDSDTEALDFEQNSGANAVPALKRAETAKAVPRSAGSTSAKSPGAQTATSGKDGVIDTTDSMAPYPFDRYRGRLYRIFEGTVLEGVVTNHIDGGFSGPVLVMLTTNYYSHDHLHLLLPQGTRLIGTVQSVGNAQQRKLFVVFHRAGACYGRPFQRRDKPAAHLATAFRTSVARRPR